MKRKYPLQLVLGRGDRNKCLDILPWKSFKNARQYKKISNWDNNNPNTITKALKFSKRLLKMSKTVMEYDEHESLKTSLPFNEFEVLKGAKQNDIKSEVVSWGSD